MEENELRLKSPWFQRADSMDAFNLYRAIGGTVTCRKLSAAFYARVERDPVLRPLFPGKTLRCAIEEFAAFLAQFLGGPSEDAQRRWWLSLRESHLRFKIGRQERHAWMKTMIQALDDVPVEGPARKALLDFF
jgi:hemoglobin